LPLINISFFFNKLASSDTYFTGLHDEKKMTENIKTNKNEIYFFIRFQKFSEIKNY